MRMDWMKKVTLGVCGSVLLGGLAVDSFAATAQMEKLGRGLSVANNGTGTFVSWRRRLRFYAMEMKSPKFRAAIQRPMWTHPAPLQTSIR